METMPGRLPEKFYFSTRSDPIAAQVNSALGKRVRVQYAHHKLVPAVASVTPSSSLPESSPSSEWDSEADPDQRRSGRRSCTSGVTLGRSSILRMSVRAKYCMKSATTPVQPVWWLAPMPAPLSPWKYS